jgi:hypothetical protein
MPARLEGLHDGLESPRAFRMVVASMMLEVIRMIDQANVHNVLLDKNVYAQQWWRLVYCRRLVSAMADDRERGTRCR